MISAPRKRHIGYGRITVAIKALMVMVTTGFGFLLFFFGFRGNFWNKTEYQRRNTPRYNIFTISGLLIATTPVHDQILLAPVLE